MTSILVMIIYSKPGFKVWMEHDQRKGTIFKLEGGEEGARVVNTEGARIDSANFYAKIIRFCAAWNNNKSTEQGGKVARSKTKQEIQLLE